MEIKASSNYDWETIRTFTNFHNLNRHRTLNVIILLMEAFMMFVFVFAAVSGTFTTGLLPSFCLFLFWNAAIIFVLFGLPKIQYNKNKIAKDSENHFVFTENEFSMTSNSGLHNGTSVVRYDGIWRIYETKKYIYLYINPRQSYIVNKATVEGGTAVDLRVFLVKSVGMSRYKLKCKI